MSLKTALGLESERKVRYGIVALGDISQESLMPGVEHTGNSVITALVTGDPAKADKVARQYDIPPESVYTYAQFGALLSSGKIDAIYLATPNWRHAEFAVPALQAGIHVLLEKPMEVTVPLCQSIIDAQQASNAKLMIAYRLHFEPATLAIIELIRAGDLGAVRGFSSVFCMSVDPQNHRAHSGTAAGPLFDLGPYPINAVRNLFQAEPTDVFAFGEKSADAGLPMDFEHTITVLLKFPGHRVGQFTVSYVADAIDTFTVFGSKGNLIATPAYGFGKPHDYELTKDSKTSTKSFKSTDHFGGELKYFSDCVLSDRDPEPDGNEGLMDVRVIEAAIESMKTGKPVSLPPPSRGRQIDVAQVQKLSTVTAPEPVGVSLPSKDK